MAEDQLLYNSEKQYFYFVDGKYPQSYVGNSFNETLKSYFDASVSESYTLVIGGKQRKVFAYSDGTEYMQFVSDKTVTIKLNGNNTTFSAGVVYYFKVEPIIWRVSDYGVSSTEYPSFYSEIRTADKSLTCVSDLVLDYGAIESDLTGAGWSYASSDMYSNISANYTAMANGFLYQGSTGTRRLVNKYNSENKQTPIVSSYVSQKVLQANMSELTKYYSDLSATASDLVCVLAGVNSGEMCAYSTRDLKNIDVGTLITKYGVDTSIWLQSQAGVRLSYAYKYKKNVAELESGSGFVKKLKNVSDYTAEDNRNIKTVVFDYLDENGQYLVNDTNVALATGTVFDVSKAQDGSIKLYIRGTTAYILSKYHIFATSLSYCFYGMKSLEEIYFNNFNTSNVLYMTYMFHGCESITNLDLSMFNTSNVIHMTYMFQGCKNLTGLDLSGFNTAKVTNMSYMFNGLNALKSISFGENFNTAKVTTMQRMFNDCFSLETLNLSAFNVSKVKNFEGMFRDCHSIKALDLTNFVTSSAIDMYGIFAFCYDLQTINVGSFITSSVKDMGRMFAGCESLTRIDLSNFVTTNVTNMAWMFYECLALQSLNLSSFNTANVKDMTRMFSGCYDLKTIDVSSFSTSSLLESHFMFYGCSSLTSLDVSSFDMSKVTNIRAMFYNCSGLTSLDVSSFNTSSVTNMGYVFYGCSGLTSLDVSNFDTSNVTDMTSMFDGCLALSGLDVSSFDTSKVVDMSYMFNGLKKATSIEFGSGFNTAKVTTMQRMFNDCIKLTELDLSSFGNVSQVVSFESMFRDCQSITDIDLSEFVTSSATNMYAMFMDCHKLETLSLSSFDTSNVVNMSHMFRHCYILKVLDISSFDTSNVVDMSHMFRNCDGLKTLDLSNFDTSKVTDMRYMFFTCSKLRNLDLSNFDTSMVTDMTAMFAKCPYLMTIYAGSDWTGAAGCVSRDMFLEDTSLRGGYKTVYSTKNDHTIAYAKIDTAGDSGSVATPGYFTSSIFAGQGTLLPGQVFTAVIKNVKDLNKENSTIKKITFKNVSELPTGVYIGKNVVVTGIGSSEIVISSIYDIRAIDCSAMFIRLKALESIEFGGGFNTSDAFAMRAMFRESSAITMLDLSTFNTAKVTDMYRMFYGCTNLKTIYASDKFTTGKVTDSERMFYGCSNLVGGNGTKYNSSYISKTYARIDKSGQKGYFTEMVSELGVLFSGNTFNIIVKNSSSYSTSNTSITKIIFKRVGQTPSGVLVGNEVYASGIGTSTITVSSVYDIFANPNSSYMFYNMTKLQSIDFSNFNTSNVTTVLSMFSGCSGLTSLDLSSFRTSQVQIMEGMFSGCSSLTSLDLSSFDTSEVITMVNMFRYCSALKSISFAKDIDTSKVTNMSNMFSGCYGLTNLNLSNFDTSSVTSMYSMFSGCSSLTRLDFSNFNTSNVTNMSYMFSNCGYLYSVDFSDFDTSNVTNMSYMFSASGFEVLDLSNFNTTNVTNMSYMFYNCDCLYEVDFSGVDTSNVTNMSYMFYSCEYLYEVNFSGIDTSNVEYMNYMFYECSDLTSLDLSSFETAEVKQMSHIFANCSSLETIYVSDGWEINGGSLVNDFGYMFEGSTNLVGGEGTTYSDVDDYQGYVAPVYARIDGGSENPGLLTGKNLVGNTYNKKTFSLILKIVCGFCFSGVLSVFVLQFVQDKKKKVR